MQHITNMQVGSGWNRAELDAESSHTAPPTRIITTYKDTRLHRTATRCEHYETMSI